MIQLSLDQKITLKGIYQRYTKSPWPRLDLDWVVKNGWRITGYRTSLKQMIGPPHIT